MNSSINKQCNLRNEFFPFQAEKYGKVNRVFPKQQKYTSELKFLLCRLSTVSTAEVVLKLK